MNAKNRNPQANNRPVVSQSQTTSWVGPLPPPEALEKFNVITPNGAERIIRMAEIEQQHRITTESAINNANINSQHRSLEANIAATASAARLSTVSLFMGFAVCILAIGAAVWTALLQCPWQIPVALVGLPLFGAVVAFITRRDKHPDKK